MLQWYMFIKCRENQSPGTKVEIMDKHTHIHNRHDDGISLLFYAFKEEM
jgi:hypothetical protein